MHFEASNDGRYDDKLFPFMRRKGEQSHVTEAYVSSPPALVVQDGDGNCWTLGFKHGSERTGEYEYDVVRNGQTTGEHACRIEMRGTTVRIFGEAGWRTWNGRTFI